MKGSIFLDFIRYLPRHPEHTLVFVIDALDECGDAKSRPRLLNVLTNAAAQALWLKIIITSRTEVDIQRFFGTLAQPSYLSYDLATDRDASDDLRTFAQSQFDSVASRWHLDTHGPKNRISTESFLGRTVFSSTLKLLLLLLNAMRTLKSR